MTAVDVPVPPDGSPAPARRGRTGRRAGDPLVPVLVRRYGKKRPLRVFVKFIGDEFEGREAWVPPARLKVPWADVDESVAREARSAAVIEAGLIEDTPQGDAASEVFERLIDEGLAEIAYSITAEQWRLRGSPR